MPDRHTIEEVEAEIARRQHGLVTRAQLRTAGFSDDIIERRIRTRRLVRMHRGVYLVGVVAPPLASEMAACLACGPDAAVSHRSAAALWQIVADRPPGVDCEVTIRRGYRRRPGVRVYRIGTLQPDEVTRLQGIPVTTAARTLYDLAGHLRGRPLERALTEAIALKLTTAAEVHAMAVRQAGRRGAARLRAILDGGDLQRTRSEAEERFLGLVRRGRVQLPAVNTRIGGTRSISTGPRPIWPWRSTDSPSIPPPMRSSGTAAEMPSWRPSGSASSESRGARSPRLRRRSSSG